MRRMIRREYSLLGASLTLVLLVIAVAIFGTGGSLASTGSPEGPVTTIEQPVSTTAEQSGADLENELAGPPQLVSVVDAASQVSFDLYWAGESFEGRLLEGATVYRDGIVTLIYKPAAQDEVRTLGWIYIYQSAGPRPLLPDDTSRKDPRPVEGEFGTYTLYTATINEMPVLEADIGGTHIIVADADYGDIAVMSRILDALAQVKP